MFDILFGWSKASKCKKAIKRARCRLRLLKNKRQAIARQLRKDLAELIQSGHEDTAVNRVKQLIDDESLAAAYELLDHFCEFILTQLCYIRRHKDCPNDINEAVSSLIYASARCGDLPELCVIRKLFGERYGQKFATTAVELFPGNLVNKQLRENLSGKSVPDDLKYKVVDEIARDNCHQQQVLAIQYYPDWQQEQVKENKGYQIVESDAQINDINAGSKVYPSETEEIKRDVTCVDSSISKPSDPCAIVPIAQQYPPYILSSPLQKKSEKEQDFPLLLSFTPSGMQKKAERMALASSAEKVSLPQYPQEMVDYVDDIEECQFSISKDGTYQDQMLFKFRPSDLSSREKTQFSCDSDIDEDESMSERSSIRSSRRSRRGPEKRSRRRSASLENIGIMDIGYMIYYHKPSRSPSAHKHGTHYHRKHQKQHSFSEKEKILDSCQRGDTKRKYFNFKMSGCSLDKPCYFCPYDENECLEALSIKPKRVIKATHHQQGVLLDECCHCRPFWDDELNHEMELVTLPQRPNRKSYSGVAEYHVFNYPECQSQVGNGNNEIKEVTSASSASVPNSWITASLTTIETEAPYSRAMTMPQERHRNSTDRMLRTYSCPSQHPNHVHPKLPDYDDIAAKFTALKREHQENKTADGDQQGK